MCVIEAIEVGFIKIGSNNKKNDSVLLMSVFCFHCQIL